MAENDLGFNPASEPAVEAVPDAQLILKKRARRRLVGAIALALLAVIVLPMVMDQEPKPLSQDIQIRIPSQDPGNGTSLSRIVPSKPAPTPLPALAKPAEPAPAPAAPQATANPEPKPDAAPAVKPTETKPPAASTPPEKPAATKVVEKPAEKAADKAPAKERKAETARANAPLNGEQWVVQLGAYQDMANVKLLQGKIKELGYPSYTEKVDTPQGVRTRVRSGPFASHEAADKAQERLKKIGAGAPTGGIVAQK